MQVSGRATFDGFIVPLGEQQQEELVPIGSHFIDNRSEIAKPSKDLFTQGCVDLQDALLKLLAVTLDY